MVDFKLKYKIEADNAHVKRALKEVDDQIAKTGSGFNLSKFTNIASIAATSVAAIATGAAAAGVALFNLTKETASYGSMIADVVDKTGLGARTITSLKYAAELGGSSIEQLTSGLGRFAKTVGSAIDGSKEAARNLKQLGIEPQDAINDLDGALGKVFKQINDARPGIERTTLAQKAFGKSGADLIPVITTFDGDLAALKKRAEELGVTLGDDAVQAADQFDDTLAQLGMQLSGVKNTIGVELLPTFTRMATDMSAWLVQNQDEIKTWADNAGTGFSAVIDVLGRATTKFKDFIDILWDFKAVRQFMDIQNMPFEYVFGDAVRRAQARKDSHADAPGVSFHGSNMRFNPVTNVMEPITGSSRTPETPSGAGTRIRPPKENDAEFRRFFTERGFDVTRTFGAAINKGSPHPSGMAADIRTRAKRIEDIFALTAAALEKGYRLVDERVKRAGIKQTGPHQHYERTGGTKASSFLGAEFYGGEQQLAYLKSLDAKRLGKATGQAGFQDFEKEQAAERERELAEAQKFLDEIIREEQEASDQKLRIYRAEAELVTELLQERVEQGVLTEEEALKRVGQLKIDLMQEERDDIAKMISSTENRLKLEELDLAIQAQQVKNQRELAALEKKRADERKKSWNEYIQNLQKEQEILDETANRAAQNAAQGAMVTAQGTLGGGIAAGMGVDLVGIFDPEQIGLMKSSAQHIKDIYADMSAFAGNAIGSMVEGLAQMGAAWFATGEFSAQAALQMVAAAAFSIATQAGFKAIFEYAEAAAAAARYDFVAAGLHTAAAKLYLKTALIAGAVGVGAGLGARAAGGGGSSGGGSSSGSGNSSSSYSSAQERNVTPISRVSEDAYISGRRDEALVRAIEKLNKKLSSMRPEDVLKVAISRSQGLIGKTVENEIASNSSLGTRILKKAGVR